MKKVIRLTESDLVNLVKRIVSEDHNPKQKRIMSVLRKCIKDADQSAYDDVYDWMDEVFSDAEDKLEHMIDIDDLRMEYGEYVQNQWLGEDDDEEDDEDED